MVKNNGSGSKGVSNASHERPPRTYISDGNLGYIDNKVAGRLGNGEKKRWTVYNPNNNNNNVVLRTDCAAYLSPKDFDSFAKRAVGLDLNGLIALVHEAEQHRYNAEGGRMLVVDEENVKLLGPQESPTIACLEFPPEKSRTPIYNDGRYGRKAG